MVRMNLQKQTHKGQSEMIVHLPLILVCGGDLTAPYGTIMSPGHPGNYPPDRDCYWTVTVAPGLLITFAFGTLNIEQHPDCSFDFLEVRNAALYPSMISGETSQ